jgi:predicted  nucleic acid-binding Zn-ribbon protein
VEQALNTWREGERLLEELPALTADHETVRLELIRLRNAYRQITGRSAASREAIASCEATISSARQSILAIRAKLQQGS